MALTVALKNQRITKTMSKRQISIKGRPIVLGEVLFDRFPTGETVLGGAPFNVAWHLQGFGADPLFISRVGKDDSGEKVRKAMRNWGMDLAGLQEDPQYPTGTVRITLDDGQPDFDIMPNQAYDHLDMTTARSILGNTDKNALLYHGTLMLRSSATRETMETLSADTGLPIFLDVNLRDPWWDESDLVPVLERARWLKVNDMELSIIADLSGCEKDDPMEAAHHIRTTYHTELLIVTRGDQGAIAFHESGETFPITPAETDEEVGDGGIMDTVGAGDAFSAVVMLGLLHGWSLPTIMQRGQAFASRVCGLRGATSPDPDFYYFG
uniref:Fructokinase n=1 Tax=Candidatus Kentrum sp. FW TaxID=2126338 RepID=A0A450S4Y7_9GAMM|nr:MAG: fructokinase [Candidatus Kentron sp. FW]